MNIPKIDVSKFSLKGFMQSTVTLVLLAYFGGVLFGPVIFHEAWKAAEAGLTQALLTMVTLAVGYYLGSSQGSARKDEINATQTAQSMSALQQVAAAPAAGSAPLPPPPPPAPGPTGAPDQPLNIQADADKPVPVVLAPMPPAPAPVVAPPDASPAAMMARAKVLIESGAPVPPGMQEWVDIYRNSHALNEGAASPKAQAPSATPPAPSQP